MNSTELYNNLKTVADKYGFSVVDTAEQIQFIAKDTDSKSVVWFCYDKKKDIIYTNNTDSVNIWLCDTRKDFTPEKCIAFVAELNKAMNSEIPLSHLIDPEDWQEIASVQDAYEDTRYTEK